MKKILLLIFVSIVILIVLIFSIPVLRKLVFNRELRNVGISLVQQGSSNEQGLSTGERYPPSSKAKTEPGIDRIKTELIGQQIPGWRFDRISEFKQAAISSIARTDQRIDYQVDLHMLPYDTKEETYYDAQIIVTYESGDDDWYLDKIELVSLSYEILIPPGRWIPITPPLDCSLQPDPEHKLAWTSKTWDYEILSGPDIGEVNLPLADNYEVKTRSKQSVRARLTFQPVMR